MDNVSGQARFRPSPKERNQKLHIHSKLSWASHFAQNSRVFSSWRCRHYILLTVQQYELSITLSHSKWPESSTTMWKPQTSHRRFSLLPLILCSWQCVQLPVQTAEWTAVELVTSAGVSGGTPSSFCTTCSKWCSMEVQLGSVSCCGWRILLKNALILHDLGNLVQSGSGSTSHQLVLYGSEEMINALMMDS